MTDTDNQQAILAEFDQQRGLYADIASTVCALLDQIVAQKGIQLHTMTQRCKNRSSLQAKLSRPGKDYRRLSDITDIAAVRVTTYFAEDVDLVTKVIEREFKIDAANSIDKRQLLDPDRFGYQSVHYVASISPRRAKLVEYSRFSNLRFEIQVRSILQHAWAEIEHDLGYKTSTGIPKGIRRRFSRVAGLLELADVEFCAIRKELSEYTASVAAEIKAQPQNVGIDNVSLQALLTDEESASRRLSQAVADVAGAKLRIDESRSRDVRILKFLDIHTIAELESTVASNFEIVRQFAVEWFGGSKYDELHLGIGIFYLAYTLLGQRANKARVREYVQEMTLGDPKQNLSEKIITFYERADRKRRQT